MKITSISSEVTHVELDGQDLMFFVCDTLASVVGKALAAQSMLSFIVAKASGDMTLVNEFLAKVNNEQNLSPYRKAILIQGLPILLASLEREAKTGQEENVFN